MIAIRSEGNNGLLYMQIHVTSEKPNAFVQSNETDDCDLIVSVQVQ